MKKLSFIAVIAIAALFQSCEKDQYHDLDKSILPYFNYGDTLIYQSNQSEDTFCITTKVLYYSQETRQRSHDYYQLCDLIMHRLPIDFYNKPTGEILALNDSSIFIHIIGYYVEIGWEFFNESVRINDSTVSYTIGTHQISNVHVLVNKGDASQVVYYHYNYGIVAYNFGELFELKEQYLR